MIPPLDHSVSIKSLIIPFTDGVKEKKYTVSNYTTSLCLRDDGWKTSSKHLNFQKLY